MAYTDASRVGCSLMDSMDDIQGWRKLFASSGADIWTVVHKAIRVALRDCPGEVRQRRDAITEQLYAPRFNSHREVAEERDSPPDSHGETSRGRNVTSVSSGLESQGIELLGERGGGSDRDGELEEKYNKFDGFDGEDEENVDCEEGDVVGKDEAEALAEDIEEENRQLEEISQLKTEMQEKDLTESQALELLEKLGDFPMSLATMQHTQIGLAVKRLGQSHGAQSVRTGCKQLVRIWKGLANDWIDSAANTARAEQEVAPRSTEEEEEEEEAVLPSPPMDAEALLAERDDLAFEEMDNVLSGFDNDLSGGSNEVDGSRRRPLNVTERAIKHPATELKRGDSLEREPCTRGRPGDSLREGRKVERTEAGGRDDRTQYGGSRIEREATGQGEKERGRVLKKREERRRDGTISRENSAGDLKGIADRGSREANTDRRELGNKGGKPVGATSMGSIGRRQGMPDLSHGGEGMATTRAIGKPVNNEEQLAIAKRKMKERYEEKEMAKRQRTIQVLEPEDVKKPMRAKAGHGRPHVPSGRW